MEQKSVCIAPLDWGLGHATRCIPIIKALIALNYKVFIASDGKQESILRTAFPNVTFLALRGYRIRYAKKRNWLVPALLIQLPKILCSIIYEYYWLKKTARKIKFDLIISDNRYGFYHKKIKSVFITHQLEIQTPFAWTTRINQKLSYFFINKYNACWIADMLPPKNLSGVLANPNKLPTIPVWYMNCLSRLEENTLVQNEFIYENTHNEAPNKIKFLGIVSGPEPQRALFENLLWQQGSQSHFHFCIAAGLPDHTSYNKITTNGQLYHHLEGNELAEQIKEATYIICRGGYTTLMELIPFKKKLILIPTPGQTEQAYLAAYWQANNWALNFKQESFNLMEAIAMASKFNYQSPPFISFNQDALKEALNHL